MRRNVCVPAHWTPAAANTRRRALLTIGAQFSPQTVAISGTPSIYDKWSASVGVEVEAGAEMSALARELTSFFAI